MCVINISQACAQHISSRGNKSSSMRSMMPPQVIEGSPVCLLLQWERGSVVLSHYDIRPEVTVGCSWERARWTGFWSFETLEPAVLPWSALWFICSLQEDFAFCFHLLIYLALPGLSCGMCLLAVAYRIFLVVACGVFNCGIQTLSRGVWALVPWPGINSGSPALGARSLSPWNTSEVPGRFGLHKIVLFCGRKIFEEHTYNLIS